MSRREGYRPLPVADGVDIKRVMSIRVEPKHGRIVLICEGEPGVVRILPPVSK